MGRPTIRTPELEARILEAWSYGLGVKYCAEYAGIAQTTLERWMSEDEIFEGRVKRARAEKLMDVAKAYHHQGEAGDDNKPAYRILAARDQGFVEAKQLTINSGAEEARLLRQAAYAIDASIEGPPSE